MDFKILSKTCIKKIKECNSLPMFDGLHTFEYLFDSTIKFKVLPIEDLWLPDIIAALVSIVNRSHQQNSTIKVTRFVHQNERFYIIGLNDTLELIPQGITIKCKDEENSNLNLNLEVHFENDFFQILNDLSVKWQKIIGALEIFYSCNSCIKYDHNNSMERHPREIAFGKKFNMAGNIRMLLLFLCAHSGYSRQKAHIKTNQETTRVFISFDCNEDFIEFENLVFRFGVIEPWESIQQ